MHGKGTIICAQCGDAFTWAKGRGSVYCSRACMTLGMRARNLPEDRFWAKVEKTEACWLWRGAQDKAGHGRFNIDGSTWLAHRFAWTTANGDIPVGAVIRHACDNPRCVRPDHLLAGTQTDNVADMVDRGRAAWQDPNKRWGSRFDRPHNAKLTERDVQVMRYLYHERHVSPWQLSRWFPIERSSVNSVVTGRTWKHVINLGP